MSHTYIVTGANRGIGLALTQKILEKGDNVVAVCRDKDKTNQLRSITNDNIRLIILIADVTNEEQLDQVSSEVKIIDRIICNAGTMGATGNMHDSKNNSDQISDVLMTNIAGPFFTIRAFLPQLQKSSSPKIAIISSFMGTQKHTSSSAYFYRASKAGVNNIMVTLGNELNHKGISIASYHPGWVRTEMGGNSATFSTDESADALLKQFETLNIDRSGRFYNYNGEELEF